jgi:hypothetical protein
MPRRSRPTILAGGASEREAGLDLLPGLQERNKEQLLDIFKAATPVLTEISKVNPETWRNMQGIFSALNQTYGVGGALRAVSGGLSAGKDIAMGNVANLMESYFMGTTLALANLQKLIESKSLENQVGSAVGGGIGEIAGTLIGIYFRNPQLGALFGGMIGGLIGLLDFSGTDAAGDDPFLPPGGAPTPLVPGGSNWWEIIGGGNPNDINAAEGIINTGVPTIVPSYGSRRGRTKMGL